uniref:zinc-ribbon domain-containing protein n=1 Tax=Rahnella variigena TaxID=574964 RepID=UPI00216A49A6|nr:zinc-ribbon domain-containing protein [Rahnella variigena]
MLHAGMPGESPWFEHDQHTVATNVLMKCAHLDPQVKADVRLNQLRKAIGELDAHASVLSWYCAWCGSHYHGAKLCSACGTGIYSIEEVNWQANYA